MPTRQIGLWELPPPSSLIKAPPGSCLGQCQVHGGIMADHSLHLVVLILLGTALCGEWMWGDQWGPPACRAVSEVAPSSNRIIPQAHVNRRQGAHVNRNQGILQILGIWGLFFILAVPSGLQDLISRPGIEPLLLAVRVPTTRLSGDTLKTLHVTFHTLENREANAGRDVGFGRPCFPHV